MIILHASSVGKDSQQLEQRLKKMVVAYQKVEYERADDDLPYIEEDGREFISGKEIEDWLLELEKELKWSRSLSGDGCYVAPDKRESNC